MAKRRSHCSRCRRPDTDAGIISKRGLCADCAEEAMRENVRQLVSREGPAYEKWRRNWSSNPGGRPLTPY